MSKIITSVAIAAVLGQLSADLASAEKEDPKGPVNAIRERLKLVAELTQEPVPTTMDAFLAAREKFDTANQQYAIAGTRIIAAVVEAFGNGAALGEQVEALVENYVGQFEGLEAARRAVQAAGEAGVTEVEARRAELSQAEDATDRVLH